MLKFHFKFEGEQTIECEAGRSSLWKAQDYGATLPATSSKQGKTDFAWGYFAASQNGILGKLGIEEGAPVEVAVEYIADNYDLTITDNKGGEDDPLASRQGK